MKKLLSLLLCSFVLAFVGCEKNEDKDLLIGNWKVVATKTNTASEYEDWNQVETTVCFSEEGTFILKGYYGNLEGKYEKRSANNHLYVDFHVGLLGSMTFEIISNTQDELILLEGGQNYLKLVKI